MTVDYEKMARDWIEEYNDADFTRHEELEAGLPELLKRVAHEAKEEQRERDAKIVNEYPHIGSDSIYAFTRSVEAAIRNQSMENAE